MAIEITCRFTTPTGEYPCATHADYFRDRGLSRTSHCATPAEADAILKATYRGPDPDGIGLTWEIYRSDLANLPTI